MKNLAGYELTFEYRFKGKGAAKKCESQRFFIKCVEIWANDNIQTYGFLTVCDVLKQLDRPVTMRDSLHGWTKDGEPVEFIFLHDGKYSLKICLKPEKMLLEYL